MKSKIPSPFDFMIAVKSEIVSDEEFWKEIEKYVDEGKAGAIIEKLYDFISREFKNESIADIIYALYTLIHVYIALLLEST